MSRALVLGVTRDLGFAAGSFLTGFFRHNPGFDVTVEILHDGLSEPDRAALARIAPRLRFSDYDGARALERLAAAGMGDPGGATRAFARWSPMMLAKFEMFDWLDRYDSLVWCDVDMLVRAPVDDLWQAGPLGWRALGPTAFLRRAHILGTVEDLIGPDAIQMPNGGLVTADRTLRDRWGIGAGDAYAMAAALMTRSRVQTVDELALFLLASHHRVPVTVLDPGLNHSVMKEEGIHEARILHTIGPDKFWNAAPLRMACPQWQADHDLWCAAGGTPAAAPDRLVEQHPLSPYAALTFARNRAFWSDLWDWLGPALPEGLWPDLTTERPALRLHPSGGDRSLWIELARVAAPKRLRITVGIEDGPDQTARALRLAPCLPPPLRRHDGRWASRWATEIPQSDLAAMLVQLRDALRAGAA